MKINPVDNMTQTLTKFTKNNKKVTMNKYPQFYMITEKEQDKPFTIVRFYKEVCDAIKAWMKFDKE